MKTKSEYTKQFIIETVAPIFNKRGYFATSMSDITKATNLTKGAVYGNFINKEDLALEVFDFNLKSIIDRIREALKDSKTASSKLYALSNFYKNYYARNKSIGGCPILNVGIDSNNVNTKLLDRVRYVSIKLQNSIAEILTEGKREGEFIADLDEKKYSGIIFSMIEGSMFTSTLLQDDSHLSNMMSHLDIIIKTQIEK